MVAAYLCLDLLLLTRLCYLRSDAALSWRANSWLFSAQLFLCLLCFSFSSAFWSLLLLLLIVFVLNGMFEARWLDKGWRLLSLFMLLAGVDLIQSVTTGFQVRPLLTNLIDLLGEHSLYLTGIDTFPRRRILILAFCLLLLTNEINVLIRLIFHAVGIEPVKPEANQSVESDNAAIDREEFNAGRVIGFLERWLIFLLVIATSELTAIGLIIAAKGLARMKQLEERHFAEYMLVGTFLSVLSAVLAGKWALLMF